jgi:hypothetical protein
VTLEIIRAHPKPPQGGWHLPIHGQVLRGRDVDEVIQSLTAYRTQNSLPLGDPEAEIAAYYADMAPWLVRERNGTPESSNGHRQIVAESTMAIWYGKYERLQIHNPIVEERAQVCAGCVFHEKSFTDEETLYWNDAATKAALMTGDMDVAKKGWCSHHRFLLALATRLVTPDRIATMPAPACCWLHTP